MTPQILEVYLTLFKAFGPQGWWPLTPMGSTKTIHHPLNSTKVLTNLNRTEIIIGAVLTQNTAWINVEKALERLHEKHLVDFQRIASVKRTTISSAIRSAGYFNQKAARLQGISKYLMTRYGGDLEIMQKKSTRELRKELLNLSGIGPETADSIILYAFGKPSFVIDAYTRRIFSRLGLIQKVDSYGEVQSWFQSHLEPDPMLFKEFHALLVGLAKKYCKSIPQCMMCPLQSMCKTGKNQKMVGLM